MVATEPIPTSTWDSIGLAGREVFADHRHVVIYGQRTADDRIAFGGRGAPYHWGSRIRAGFDHEGSVFDDLRATLAQMLPSSTEWASPMPGEVPSASPVTGTPASGWTPRPGSAGPAGTSATASRPATSRAGPWPTWSAGGTPAHLPALGRAPLPSLGARAAAVARHQRRPAPRPLGRPRGGAHGPPRSPRPASRRAHRALIAQTVRVALDPADLSDDALAFLGRPAPRHADHPAPGRLAARGPGGLHVGRRGAGWLASSPAARAARRATPLPATGRCCARWRAGAGSRSRARPGADLAEAVRDAEERYAARYRVPRENPLRVVVEIGVDRVLGNL